jgi:transcriptional regulator with XRE-family HTH domain
MGARAALADRQKPQARTAFAARRRAQGFTQQTLAAAMPCNRTTVGRWESGESDVAAYHRPRLADLLDVTMPELAQLIDTKTLPSLSHGWWSNYETLEQAANVVRNYEPVLIPGLLQTQAYADSLLAVDDLVARRLSRQDMITRRRDPVALRVVIDESTLYRPIGGLATLHQQLQHLALLAERSNISIRILPLTAAAQPAYWGSLVVLGFPYPGGLVYLEHQEGAAYLDSRGDVESHLAVFDQLEELSLSVDESMGLVTTRVREIKDEHSK